MLIDLFTQAVGARTCLPQYLGLPLQLLPANLRNSIMAQTLNLALVRERGQGELDFLTNRHVQIAVTDAALVMSVTLFQGNIQPATSKESPDLIITGTLYDYLLLLTGKEDPDTLFFQRRLSMQGDTGLGVHLKNFLASIDPASLPLGNLLQPALVQGRKFYEWLM